MMRSKTSLFVLLILLFCPLVALNAQSFLQASSARDVAFSFYKTAEATPNYERWIKQSEPYLSTPQAKWAEVIDRQTVFLSNAFQNHDHERDLIIVKSKARAVLDEPHTTGAESTKLTFKFQKEKNNREVFFPYDYGGDNFAVIVDGLDELKEFTINPKEVPYIKSQLTKRTVDIVLRLAPVSADIETPYMIENEPFWMLGTRVASLSLWNEADIMIYEYIAPWYFTPTSNTIEELKTQQEEIQSVLDGIELDPILLPIETP